MWQMTTGDSIGANSNSGLTLKFMVFLECQSASLDSRPTSSGRPCLDCINTASCLLWYTALGTFALLYLSQYTSIVCFHVHVPYLTGSSWKERSQFLFIHLNFDKLIQRLIKMDSMLTCSGFLKYVKYSTPSETYLKHKNII